MQDNRTQKQKPCGDLKSALMAMMSSLEIGLKKLGIEEKKRIKNKQMKFRQIV